MKHLPHFLVLLGLLSGHGQGQTPAPRLLPFQARLTDATGQPIADDARVVQFQIFGEPAGGTPLWAGEVHRASINGGLINVLLGSRNPLPTDRADEGGNWIIYAGIRAHIDYPDVRVWVLWIPRRLVAP